ncbi:hypothetical protein PHLGIDRAFT_400565 [Phlebiopsis gigantea 11061_1 CR5-6]|uniref:Uncharacterized protein n=1 Tax=Phlebiopsis gigantea (strain 11061_1 CR5-6) TaxID=745531 RepID=A0A0C3P2E6_PHLG1|nr:hypothetical protein PHLGIDRAFT_400565 [Phlebiopsis gigantea 11061_1 CR5-6]
MHFLACLYLEALLKLIHGTGTWVAPPGSNVSLDQPSATEFDKDNPIPPSFPQEFGTLFKFAFSRVPRSVETVGERSFQRSADKRYNHCTALVMKSDAEESSFAGVELLLPALREHFPTLEELRITTSVRPTAWKTFTLFMASLTSTFGNWRTLRQISIDPAFNIDNVVWTLPDEVQLSSSPTR